MIKKVLLSAALSLGLTNAAMAETQVRMLHIETTPEILKTWDAIKAAYEKKNPDVKISLEFLDNEAFKAKLPTLLQSKQRPDIFYSWGGGNYQVQVEEGLLKDVTKEVKPFVGNLSDGAVAAFKDSGKLYGLPYMVSGVGFWYNKPLFAKAGITEKSMSTWSGFLDGVKKLKAAGVTPIAVGGADKWPMHFYWSYLVMRAGGQAAFEAAMNDKGKGFEAEGFVRASAELQKLANLKPFQDGWLAAGYGESAGTFGDHKAAMHLMGDWDYAFARQQSTSKKGVEDKDLGWLPFPALEGGKGNAGDTLGGINGWALSKDASKEAVKWLSFFLNKDNQTKLAGGDFIIPVAKGADAAIKNVHKKTIAKAVAESSWHQVFFDQALGSDVGSVVNDISVELASGSVKPAEAVARIQEAWELR